MSYDFDLAVLGGGPAGYPAAIRAAQLGAGVCLVEKGHLGGVCLNRGCIPTKTLHAMAHLMEQAGGGAVSGGISPDWAGLMNHKNKVVDDLVAGVGKLLEGRGVEVVGGKGRIAAPGRIEIENYGSVTARSIIVATGSSEIVLPGLESDGKSVLTSTDLLEIDHIPESLIIVGGGVIGCEFASIFNAFGTRVEIVEMLPGLIATEDSQIARYLQTFFRKKGITAHLGSKVEDLKAGDGVTAVLDNGREIRAEAAMVSVGRSPNTAGIGLEEAGVGFDRSGIKVDAGMRTGVEGIYAAGDVIGGWLLAHVATREGIVAAENALGGSRKVDYSKVPSTVYTLPEISRAGMTEDEARKEGIDYVTGRFPFAANGKAKGLREEDGFVKWVASKDSGRLLGLHIIGPQATELVSPGLVALGSGMTVEEFAEVIFPHPTLCETLGEAAEAAAGRAIHLLR